MLFIQRLTKISYIGTLYKIWLIQDSVLIRNRFKQVSLYIHVSSIDWRGIFTVHVILNYISLFVVDLGLLHDVTFFIFCKIGLGF